MPTVGMPLSKTLMKNFKIFSALHFALVACIISFTLSAPVRAQGDMDDELPEDGAPAGTAAAPLPAQGTQILEVDDKTVESLRRLNLGPRPDAISLSASAASLEADPESRQALAAWVRDGGVVFLHSDAAEIFGFQTVEAREADNRGPGQLFGRARATLPFAAHPLLVSGVPSAAGSDLPALDRNAPLPPLGVRNVFYQMEVGDQLVVSHPAGIPLLRVVDSAGAGDAPLYAAAIAPFGNGWALVIPRLVEQQRGDGAMFVQNLLRFAKSSSRSANGLFDPPLGQPVPAVKTEPLASLPASLIELASQTASDGGDLGLIAAPWNAATAPPNPALLTDPAEVLQPATESRLVLTAGEVAAVRASLVAAIADATEAGEAPRAHFRVLAYLLRARLEFQKGDLKSAITWMEAADEISPDSAEVLLWRGVLAAAQAEDITLDSPTRARLLSDAVQCWSGVLNAKSLFTVAAQAEPIISGIPALAIQSWIAAGTRAGELANVEPPLVTVLGQPERLVVLRHFPNDPTLKLAVPTGDLLARASNFMGWDVEDEEILIFPDERYYLAYSTAARTGSREVAFNPLARRGNVVDNRILMVSQTTTNVFVPGPPPRFVPLGMAVPATLGRLHAQVLMNALAEGGSTVPPWMQLGLMSISNLSVVNTLAGNTPMSPGLSRAVAAGTLLSPDQFRNVNLGADESGLAEQQANRLMLYFYSRFGAGGVAETLQRLGAGETPESALMATTGMTEVQFFQAWRQAELGG